MSSLLDGLSNIYSITAKINSLKDQTTSTKSANNNPNQNNIEETLLNLQKSFNEMLNSLISSSDEDKDKEKSDPFAFLMDYQNSINLLNNPISQNNITNNASLYINSYTGSIENSNLNQNNAQYNLLTEQYKLNLDNIF